MAASAQHPRRDRRLKTSPAVVGGGIPVFSSRSVSMRMQNHIRLGLGPINVASRVEHAASLQSQVQWVVRSGVPTPMLEDLTGLAGQGNNPFQAVALTLEQIRVLCAESEDCVGFEYCPETGAWRPKKVDDNRSPATATYEQPLPGEQVWEFHYISRRAPAPEHEQHLGPRLRVWLEGVEQFPHVRQRRGQCSCCVPEDKMVSASISLRPGRPSGSDAQGGDAGRIMTVSGWQEESGDANFEFDEDDPFEVSLDSADGLVLRFDASHLVGRRRKKGSLLGRTGYTTIPLKDLARQQRWRLMLFQEATSVMTAPDEALYGTDRPDEQGTDIRRPTFIRVRTEVAGCDFEQRRETDFVPRWRPPADFEPRRQNYRPNSTGQKRVMLITRGTRGDVQPFVALARGLALPPFNCEVTLVTELCNKEFVKKGRAGLPPGSLRFRPSGGNTPKYLEGAASQLMMSYGQDIDLIQSFFFAMAEATMFNSEGTCFYWATVERPDFVVFGFNMCHIAMIMSEALQIPCVGFFLQPTRKVEKRKHALSFIDEVLVPFREKINGATFNAVLQQVFEQVNATGESLYYLRQTRGLTPTPLRLADEDLHFKEMLRQTVPMVVPIHSLLVDRQTQAGMTYTDFIFLRLTQDQVSDESSEFISKARQDGRLVGVMTFSSMPIGLRQMLKVAFEVCEHAFAPSDSAGQPGKQPALIVMGAGQEAGGPPTAEQLEKVEELRSQNRLLLLRRGEPFGALFPMLDFSIMHGGLGVTSEALLAGMPVITSGIQLLDQRWWGARMADLGCGSAGIPFARLLRRGTSGKSRILEQLDLALDRRRSTNGRRTWHETVQQVGRQIAPRQDDPDGVMINARAVFEAAEQALPIMAAFEDESKKSCCGSQARCCYRSCRKLAALCVVQVPMACGSACYRACSRFFRWSESPGMVGMDAGFVRSSESEVLMDSDSELGSVSESGEESYESSST